MKPNMHLPHDPAIALSGIYQRIENLCSCKHLYVNVNSRFISDNKKTGSSPNVFLWLNKFWYTHIREHYSETIKEWTTDTCKNSDEPPSHYVILKMTKLWRWRITSVVGRHGGQIQGDRRRKFLYGDEIALYLVSCDVYRNLYMGLNCIELQTRKHEKVVKFEYCLYSY